MARPAGRPSPRRPQAPPRGAAPHGHRGRFRVFTLGIAAAAVVLVGRLVIVQVFDAGAYASYAKSEIEQRVTLPAIRGAIYDRSGDLLAVSVVRYDVIADDLLITDPAATAATLAPQLHEQVATLETELSARNGYVVLAHQVSGATHDAIAADGVDGISFASDDLRVSPGGSLFEPLLGGVNAAGQGDAALEYQFNSLLAGKPGSEVVAEAPGGVQLPGPATAVAKPQQGTSVVLTLDEPLQVEVTNDVAAQMRATHSDSGIAVVMDVHSGDILAMVDLVTGPHGTIAPAGSNLALTSIYQPGSVMKLATVSFALQDHLISPQTVFSVPYALSVGGYTFQDADYHPIENLPVSQILAQSSNIGTIEISRLLGLNRLAGALSDLGFGHYSGLNWPGESPGIVGTPAQWVGSSAASVPIGTGVAVTPMQVLDAFNAVANGGVMVAPRLLRSTVDAKSALSSRASSGRRVLEPSTVSQLVPMLQCVVQDGTAVLAKVPGYDVAGKTGTAQVPDPSGLGYVPGDWNASFVGFVPAESPQLAGLVVLNHPSPIYGGTVSAPVFAQIMQYALRHFDIAPPVVTPTEKVAARAACPVL